MDWASGFDSSFVLKIEGILDVFQIFINKSWRKRTTQDVKRSF
jgi:hypothetical protein